MHVWRERLSRWLGPLAQRCPLSPNTITVIALLLNLVAAWLLAIGARQPAFFLLAIVLVIVAGFADALDGIVARVQQKETQFGDFLDHLCDRISDTLLAACWMIGNGVREALVVAAMIAIMLNGYISTQIEASFRQRNYESIGRGEFVLALVIFPVLSFILFSSGWNALRFAGATIAEWLSILLLIFALLGVAQRIGVARRMERS
jgi:archaetidylinositol phosphate synthase